jgi:hypothetical protein
MLFAACKKSDSTSTSKGTFTIGSASYTVSSIADSTYYITAGDSNGNYVEFIVKPSNTLTTGTYDVVDAAIDSNNQIHIGAYNMSNSRYYMSYSGTGVKVSVTANGNSKKITLPQIKLFNLFAHDTILVSASITK